MATSAPPLIARVYQEDALAQALERNVVVRADTGSGKTHIAVMLIREIALTASDGSLVVFLTPTVSLVSQQAAVLREHTLLRVKTFVGADGVEFWKRETWQDHLRQAEAIVLTPQIFLDMLSKAYWSLEKVSLIVLDECHHAAKKHPYAEIMRQHYHPQKPASRLPRILGLTASPIWNVKRPEKAIADLEALLDCRILEIGKHHSDEMSAHSPKAIEQLIEHEPEPPQADEAYSLLLERLKSQVILEDDWGDRLDAARSLFGLAGFQVLIYQLAKERRVDPTFLAELALLNTTPAPPHALSQKFQALIDTLAERQRDADFHSIVFCQQRHHAHILVALLRRVPSLSSWLRAAALVGHGDRGRGGASPSDQQLKEAGMAVKELNLIVATQVAEEGLDFRRCNLVVRFDGLTTITGYIQSRGRARQAKARFVVLAEKDSADASRYKEYVEQEAALQAMYATRPLDAEELQEPELDDLPTYWTPAGALLTHQSAIPLLAEFCQLIRFDAFTPLQKPRYSVGGVGILWRCELRLPKIRAISQSTFVSAPLATKKVSKQRAAFEVCIALHRAGALDDHLLPVREPTGKGAKDADGRQVDRNVLPKTLDISIPNVYGNVYSRPAAHLHIFELSSSSGTSRLGLVCVRTDVTSSSSTPEVEVDPPKKKVKMIQRYSEYWLYVKVAYAFHELEASSKNPIVQIDPLDLDAYNALVPPQPDYQAIRPVSSRQRTFSAAMVRTTTLPLEFWQTFALVPSLEHLITSRLHADLAIERFSFPAVDGGKLVEALTAPVCTVGYSYETLEFVGDSALKLATSVHIFLEYPTAEEDRLTRLRENSVDNRFLRRRSLDTGFSSFIIPHILRTSTFVPPTSDDAMLSTDGATMTRTIGRRLLSDTMEATLGAAVATGGLEMAIELGDKLGLCFGGTTPWSERASAKQLLGVEAYPAGQGMKMVEEALGYRFEKQGKLLAQALTHRSYAGGSGYCYEREEYLGDAILDYWCTSRLFALFPDAAPRNLTYKRALLVSNGVLVLLAIRKLGLHKAILHSSPTLEGAMQEAAEVAEGFEWKDAVEGGLTWMWSPPKVLGDVLEALLAVVFIDSRFNLESVSTVLDKLYEEVMPFLSETEVRDPYSRLLMWKDQRLCKELAVKVIRIDPSAPTPATTNSSPSSGSTTPLPVFPPSTSASRARAATQTEDPYYLAHSTFHSLPLAPPSKSSSKAVARQLAAKVALEVLGGMEERGAVEGICGCRMGWERDKARRKREEKERATNEVGDGRAEKEEEGKETSQSLETEEGEAEDGVEDDEERFAAEETEQHEERELPIRVREY
ncbi:hypothetical protein JCM11641_003421 [Rhodosporidiobolus odoratus]